MVLICTVSTLTLKAIYHIGSVKGEPMPEEGVRQLDDHVGRQGVRGSRGRTLGGQRRCPIPPLHSPLPLILLAPLIYPSISRPFGCSIRKLAVEPRVVRVSRAWMNTVSRARSGVVYLFFLSYLWRTQDLVTRSQVLHGGSSVSRSCETQGFDLTWPFSVLF